MKTTEKHTPGPWKAETNEKSASITILGRHGDPMRCRASDGHGSIVIVECWEDYSDQPFAPMLPEQVANAHLIAAAPDLLAALKSLLEFVRAHSETGEVIPPHTVEHVRALDALAKAEARKP